MYAEKKKNRNKKLYESACHNKKKDNFFQYYHPLLHTPFAMFPLIASY